jgi:hypothetical protein
MVRFLIQIAKVIHILRLMESSVSILVGMMTLIHIQKQLCMGYFFDYYVLSV